MISGIVAHLWHSTVLLSIAWVVTLFLRGNAAKVRYWVWFTASAKFLVPFSFLINLGALIPHSAETPVFRTEWVTAAQEISLPFAFALDTPHTKPASTVSRSGYFPYASWGLWSCGFAVVTFCWLLRWKRVYNLQKFAHIVSVSTDLKVLVPVMSVPGLIEPGVFGILQPILLMPEFLVNDSLRFKLDAILMHEFSHIRRRDNLTAAIHMVVQAIFWFYPLTWWIGKRLIEERERACDEEVLGRGCNPNVYAESILTVCKLCLASPLACMSGVTGADLTKRIEWIIKNQGQIRLTLEKKVSLAFVGMLVLVVPIAVGMLNSSALWSQEQPVAIAHAQFEVASLKLSPGCEKVFKGGHLSPSPGRFEMPCVTLAGLLQSAYGTFGDGVTINTQPLPIEGGPSWMQSEHYVLSAKVESPIRTEMLAGPMLQAFLEERFRLKTHQEMRERPVYAMTVRKDGLKVQPLAEGACTPLDLTHPPPPSKPGDSPVDLCGVMIIRPTENGTMKIEVRGSTMTQLAQRLSGRADRIIIDKTGVPGLFNFSLEFMPNSGIPGQSVTADDKKNPDNTAKSANLTLPPDSAPNLSTALEEQIGLKLSSDKGPIRFLIIDHVEKPTSN